MLDASVVSGSNESRRVLDLVALHLPNFTLRLIDILWFLIVNDHHLLVLNLLDISFSILLIVYENDGFFMDQILKTFTTTSLVSYHVLICLFIHNAALFLRLDLRLGRPPNDPRLCGC